MTLAWLGIVETDRLELDDLSFYLRRRATLAAGSDVHAVRVLPRPAADVYAGPAAGGGEFSPPEQTTPVRLPLDAIGRIRPRRRIWPWSWQ